MQIKAYGQGVIPKNVRIMDASEKSGKSMNLGKAYKYLSIFPLKFIF